MTPQLSVIVPALLGYERTRTAIDAWCALRSEGTLEILVLCPDPSPSDVASASDAGCRLVPMRDRLLNEARARAIADARAGHVVIAEDHCLPNPGWVTVMLSRMAEGWDAIGPAIAPGVTESRWAQAAFVLGYSEWMAPGPGGPDRVLPGHNIVVRREMLTDVGAALGAELLISSLFMGRLRASGRRFYFEPAATMRHFDPAEAGRALSIFAEVGLGFGAVRTRNWPFVARLAYPLALPLIAARHWNRAFTQARRAGASAALTPGWTMAAVCLAVAWAAGEAAGAILGVDRVEPRVWRTETKPVSVETLKRASR